MDREDLIRKARILVMDPNPAGANGLCARLAMAGWRTRLVADEVEALSTVRTSGADLALLRLSVDKNLDMDLPNVLRRVASNAYLPVVVLAKSLAEGTGWHTSVDWEWRMKQEIDGQIKDLPLMRKWLTRVRGK